MTGTYDGLVVKLYIDGILSVSSNVYTTPTPIYHNANNTFFIGAEAGGNATTPVTANSMFTGNLSDFRLYATALSADDVLELYNTAASLSQNGTLFTNELIEV